MKTSRIDTRERALDAIEWAFKPFAKDNQFDAYTAILILRYADSISMEDRDSYQLNINPEKPIYEVFSDWVHNPKVKEVVIIIDGHSSLEGKHTRAISGLDHAVIHYLSDPGYTSFSLFKYKDHSHYIEAEGMSYSAYAFIDQIGGLPVMHMADEYFLELLIKSFKNETMEEWKKRQKDEKEKKDKAATHRVKELAKLFEDCPEKVDHMDENFTERSYAEEMENIGLVRDQIYTFEQKTGTRIMAIPCYEPDNTPTEKPEMYIFTQKHISEHLMSFTMTYRGYEEVTFCLESILYPFQNTNQRLRMVSGSVELNFLHPTDTIRSR